ncbi:MAG: CehA/McbA family metallohydrolase [Rubripirellula sp.]|nr:CehA/McbA family metallohydrolase [Rubripirellula sp.]
MRKPDLSDATRSLTRAHRSKLPLALLTLSHLFVVTLTSPLRAEVVTQFNSDQMQDIRSGIEREWSEFPAEISDSSYKRQFTARVNSAPWTLSIRQQDVKELWTISVNGTIVGRLVRDENDLRCDFEIPPGLLHQSDNELVISTQASSSDEIRVGEIEIHDCSPNQLRKLATVEVVITDTSQRPMPGRITIVDDSGTLIPVHAFASASPSLAAGQKDDAINGKASNDPKLASRQGVVYSATGHAFFGVSPGRYRIYAGRGFEYSVAKADFTIQHGQHLKRTLQLEREVDTEGWIACDTHVHTVTHSGHGDCTLLERLVTLAGEGIELPIATDHNTQIDYTADSQSLGTSPWFTPVVGNEVTTKKGHFNIFPTSADAARPNHQAADWSQLFDSIFENPQVAIAILNHARDIHSGFRPFSPRHHVSLTGTNRDGFDRRFNAMELINSGAVQTDPMELFRDWCGLINHGLTVTPVGSSDSHDVSRYIVGQGRTYIQCDDSDPSAVDIEKAVTAFLEGKVIVSYGLLAKLSAGLSDDHSAGIDDIQWVGPGELLSLDAHANQTSDSLQTQETAPISKEGLGSKEGLVSNEGLDGNEDQGTEISGFYVTAEVLFPSWSEATEIELWLNGRPWTNVNLTTPISQTNQESSASPSGEKLTHHNLPTPQVLVKRETNRILCNWTIPPGQLRSDSWLTVVAKGPGIKSPHWPTAKPYQPDSIQFQSYVFSCSGPLRIDTDGDGIFSSPREQALSLLETLDRGDGAERINLDLLRDAIDQVDPAVADQILQTVRPEITDFSDWMTRLPKSLKNKVEPFERAWQESTRADLEGKE